jgi:DNA-binding LacI/PurR family transcriptional regulator
MGELAAEQLLRRIQQGEAGGGGEGRSLRVGAKLVVRRSTAALPAS